MEQPENTDMNRHIIKLINRKKLLYKPIYDFNPVQLETLKTYIETYLKIGFIQPSKSFAGSLIIFDKKSDGNFCLYIKSQQLNY